MASKQREHRRPSQPTRLTQQSDFLGMQPGAAAGAVTTDEDSTPADQLFFRPVKRCTSIS